MLEMPINYVDERGKNAVGFINLYDDKKEKHNSFEACVILEIDSSPNEADPELIGNGFGNLNLDVTGYGQNQEDAIVDLNRVYNTLMINLGLAIMNGKEAAERQQELLKESDE